MRIILEIPSRQDLKFLLPLLERLKIKVFEWPPNAPDLKDFNPEVDDNKGQTERKNFDEKELSELFEKLKLKNAFSAVEDPVKWQKKLRDEWN